MPDLRRINTDLILRSLSSLCEDKRLEGWPQGTPWPCFETRRLRDAPQHEDGVEARGLSYSIGLPVRVASSFSRRGEIWPVTGSLRSRSSFWIAAIVSGP